MKQICFLVDDEQQGFLLETLETSLAEAIEVLMRHETEEPPLFDVQTIGEAAEDFTNLIASQRRRIAALKYFQGEVKK